VAREFRRVVDLEGEEVVVVVIGTAALQLDGCAPAAASVGAWCQGRGGASRRGVVWARRQVQVRKDRSALASLLFMLQGSFRISASTWYLA
jgi:hypothetical protein